MVDRIYGTLNMFCFLSKHGPTESQTSLRLIPRCQRPVQVVQEVYREAVMAFAIRVAKSGVKDKH